MSSQEIIQKYRKILEKPMAEPHRGYIEELVEFISGMSDRKAPAARIHENDRPSFKAATQRGQQVTPVTIPLNG